MTNIKERAKNAVMTVKKKAIPVAVSAATALSAVSVTAFAAEGDTTSMYQTIADAFKSGASALGDGIALIMGAVVPIAVGIIGLYAALGAGKKILTKLSS